MSVANPLNLYSGPDSMKKYFDPDYQPPLPLVEVPKTLNPYYDDGIRIYAKMMTMLPAHNVKALPAMGLLEECVRPGKTQTVIEYSSGSTVISMSMISRVFHGIDDVRAYLSNKTSDAKLQLMQFFGLNVTLFGGPSQPEPTDDRGGIQRARRMAETDEKVANPNQYENDANWTAHYRWTGPQIMRQLPEINVICVGMGTSGTMTGIGTYIKDHKPSVHRIGVCTAPGDRIPGPRTFALLAPVLFPWRKALDVIEEVASPDAFALSMQLSREGLVCGPSSGFNLKGLYQFIERRKAEGNLRELAGPDGLTHCVFVCCDLPYQYIHEYFDKLGEEHFHPVVNKHLAEVDLYRYDEAWELDPAEAVASRFETVKVTLDDHGPEIPSFNLRPGQVIIDLREARHFEISHLPGAINLPLESLNSMSGSPFYNADLLSRQWSELNSILKPGSEPLGALENVVLADSDVLILCYNGDTSRMATSILRNGKVNASSCRGGMARLDSWLQKQNPQQVDSGSFQAPTLNLSSIEVFHASTPATPAG